MTKNLLIAGLLWLAFAPVSPAVAADLTFSVTNEQVSGETYTADLLVQHASGTTELVPLLLTATGQYDFSIATPGSPYTPPGQASFRVWGPGTGSGNTYSGPGGGGGSAPPGQIVHGVGNSLTAARTGDAEIQVWPIGAWIVRAGLVCLSGRITAAGIAEFHCRNSGGLKNFSYGYCGETERVECHQPPTNPPAPVEPNPRNGGSGGGHHGGPLMPPRLIFAGFSTQVPEGVVEVGEVINE